MKKRAVFGLGNPGPEYELTRHNIGFRAVRHLSRLLGAPSFQSDRYALHTEVYKYGIQWHLFLPTTYMNRSGDAVAYWQKALKLDPSELIVVLDEIQLPLGRMRLQPKGSSGGHNGLSHVIERLGSTEFPRLRIGIDKNFPRGAQVEYVLSPFTEGEETTLREMIPAAAEALLRWGREGIASAASFAGSYCVPIGEQQPNHREHREHGG